VYRCLSLFDTGASLPCPHLQQFSRASSIPFYPRTSVYTPFIYNNLYFVRPRSYPALKNGDRVLALRKWPRAWLRKGQIVLVDPWIASQPTRTGYSRLEKPFIKRIAALGGDTLVTSITDLYSDLRPRQLPLHDETGKRTWHIPPGSIFALSDNRPSGMDSLTWGPVPSKTVLGVVIAKLSSSPDASLRGTRQ
jgi:signal peptidase I